MHKRLAFFISIICSVIILNCTAWDASREKQEGRPEVYKVSFEGIEYEKDMEELSKKEGFKGPDFSEGRTTVQENLVKLDAMRRCPVKGRTVVTFILGVNGEVIKPQVILGIHPKCDEFAVAAFSGVIFTPATLEGKPIAVQSTLPIYFE